MPDAIPTIAILEKPPTSHSSGRRSGPPLWCQDAPYAAAFVLTLAMTVTGACLALWLNPHRSSGAPALVAWLTITGIAACCVAVFLVLVFQTGPAAVLSTSLLQAAVCLGVAIGCRGQPVAWPWALAFAAASLNLLWLLVVRQHLRFLSIVSETSSSCLTLFPGIVAVTLAVVACMTLYVFAWALALSLSVHLHAFPRVLWIAACILSLQWTAEVLRNGLQVIVVGVVGMWYFGERDPSTALKPVGLRDALGPSLGSICCGSTVSGVVVPLYSALLSLHSAAESMKSSTYAALFLGFLLHKLHPALQHFNLFAFAHVAFYGKPYFQAARAHACPDPLVVWVDPPVVSWGVGARMSGDAWALTTTCGLTRVFNDSLLGTVPLLSSLAAGALLGAMVGLITQSGFLALMCTIQAALVTEVVLTACTSVAVALFMGYAERPEALQGIHGVLYDRISEAAAESAAAGLVPRLSPRGP